MKLVKGPSDHVVIVGAGLAGLSTALHLAGSGRKVTILERESVPGGRNGLLQTQGYSFDTGPTVLTMPSLIEEAFKAVGESMNDWLKLKPVSPLYRAFYHDGSSLDVHANTSAMTEEIRRVIGADEAAGYEKYVEFVSKLYKYEMKDFKIDSVVASIIAKFERRARFGKEKYGTDLDRTDLDKLDWINHAQDESIYK